MQTKKGDLAAAFTVAEMSADYGSEKIELTCLTVAPGHGVTG